MHSFSPILVSYINNIKPKRCFEWGPGHSTSLFLKNISDDSLLFSIEHDIKYYNIVKNNTPADPRWSLVLQNATKRVSTYAHCIFNYSHFDIILVDGRRRVECCFAAMSRLSPGGVILLHDSCRKQYTDIINPFINTIENIKDTLVFEPKILL